MTKTDTKIDEILKIGIATEINGYNFYTEFAERVTRQETKNKIKTLAGDEKKHREILENIYREYFNTEPSDIPGKGMGVFMKALKDRKLTVDISAPGLLDIAIEAESASHDFYAEGADAAADEKVKEVFNRLAEEENSHFELLTAEKTALAGLDWYLGGSAAEFEY
jgi:rubrerythrin